MGGYGRSLVLEVLSSGAGDALGVQRGVGIVVIVVLPCVADCAVGDDLASEFPNGASFAS